MSRSSAGPAAPTTKGSRGANGDVNPDGFDATAFLRTFDYGRVSTLPDGQIQREYEITAVDREIEVAPAYTSLRGPTTGRSRDRRSAAPNLIG